MMLTGYYSNLLDKVSNNVKTLLKKRKAAEPQKEIFTILTTEKYILIY